MIHSTHQERFGFQVVSGQAAVRFLRINYAGHDKIEFNAKTVIQLIVIHIVVIVFLATIDDIKIRESKISLDSSLGVL